MLVRYGQRPNELTVKKLAMLGCVALVLAHSVKDIREKLQNNTYAGDQTCYRPPCLDFLMKILTPP